MLLKSLNNDIDAMMVDSCIKYGTGMEVEKNCSVCLNHIPFFYTSYGHINMSTHIANAVCLYFQ